MSVWTSKRIGDQARQFASPRFAQLEQAVQARDISRVEAVANAVRKEYLVAHDGLIWAIARALSQAVKLRDTAQGEDIGFQVISQFMGEGDPPQYSQSDYKTRVRQVAAGWHWHATTFRVVEDDDRVSFILEPCGSGMRLVLSGAYLGTDPLELSDTPNRSNFMSKDFPNYCNHCSEMTHLALRGGSTTFLVEGWTDRRRYGGCLQHSYKSLAAVPSEFFQRVALPVPPAKAALGEAAPKRAFGPEELKEIETHPLDRLVGHAKSGNIEAALRAVEECRSGWEDSIHDVAVRWFSIVCSEVQKRYGTDDAASMLKAAAPEIFVHVMRAHNNAPDEVAWAAFWSIQGGLQDVRDAAGGLEYVNALKAVIDPELVDPELFVKCTNQGAESRGWTAAVRLDLDQGHLLHKVRSS
jgi:hypothetical protein